MKVEKEYRELVGVYNNIMRNIPVTKSNKRLVAELKSIHRDKVMDNEFKRRKISKMISVLSLGLQIGGVCSVFIPNSTIQEILLEGISFKISTGKDVELSLFKDHAQVLNSYIYNHAERKEIIDNIFELGEKNDIKIAASAEKMESEWKVHNFCYKLGICKDSVKDADLDFVADNRWYVDFATNIVTVFCFLTKNAISEDLPIL